MFDANEAVEIAAGVSNSVMPANAGIHDFGANNEGPGVRASKQVVDARFRGHDGVRMAGGTIGWFHA